MLHLCTPYGRSFFIHKLGWPCRGRFGIRRVLLSHSLFAHFLTILILSPCKSNTTGPRAILS